MINICLTCIYYSDCLLPHCDLEPSEPELFPRYEECDAYVSVLTEDDL